jgi:hypothetical protein
LIITAQKGVSLDFDAAGRDAKTQSKELYLWGQTQDDGIKGESISLIWVIVVILIGYVLGIKMSPIAWRT